MSTFYEASTMDNGETNFTLTSEPTVINDDIIQEALYTMLPTGKAGTYAKEAGIESTKTKHLKIEYKSIVQICNLSHMTLLTKLQLCNNVISKIENLDALENLEWLDLSFNSICKIENLDNLRKLNVLNLHRNCICKLEGIDSLLKLEIFSISSNNVQDIDDLKYLRRFVCLRSLQIDGNPMMEHFSTGSDETFRDFVIALLPQLVILDYKSISKAEREQANLKYQDKMDKTTVVDDKLRRRYSVVLAEEDVKQVHAKAFVAGFEDDQFWDYLIENDDEQGKAIMELQETRDVQVVFKELFRRATRELFEKGLKNYSSRDNEYAAWTTATKQEKQIVQAKVIKSFEDFEEHSSVSLKDMKMYVTLIEDIERRFVKEKPEDYVQLIEALSNMAKDYVKRLHFVWFDAMTAENTLHEKLVEVNEILDESIKEAVTTWLDQLRGHFSTIRDLQTQLHERLIQVLLTFGNYRLSDDSIPQHLKHLNFSDKETLSNGLEASYDCRMQCIDKREEEMVSNLTNWLKDAHSQLSRTELWRNRRRVAEISHFSDTFYYKYFVQARILSHVNCHIPSFKDDQDRIPISESVKTQSRASQRTLYNEEEEEDDEDEEEEMEDTDSEIKDADSEYRIPLGVGRGKLIENEQDLEEFANQHVLMRKAKSKPMSNVQFQPELSMSIKSKSSFAPLEHEDELEN